MNQADHATIRLLSAEGWDQKRIAEKMGVSRSCVSHIVTGRSGWTEDPQARATIQGLRDAKLHANRRLKESLRTEDLFNILAQLAPQYLKPVKLPPAPKIPANTSAVEETAVLVISDGHHDQVVTPAEVGGIEDYNFLVSVRRGYHLTHTVRKFCTKTLQGYYFPKLVVFFLGDSTGGEIHEAEKRSFYGNQFKNSVAISQLYTRMLGELSASFGEIETHWVAGNHGRRTEKKEFTGPQNNWDYLIAEMTRASFSLNGRISFNIPNSWSSIVDVEGYGFHISHGDDIANTGGNPWIGLRKRHERQASINRGLPVDYAVIGHHHTPGIVSGNGVNYICNGAWLATDQFAYNKLGVGGPPTQMLFGVNKARGTTWQLPIQISGEHDFEASPYDSISN